MEITREGERFLEVRFKRREQSGLERHRQECEQSRDVLKFAGEAQRRYYELSSQIDPEQHRILVEGSWDFSRE